MSATPDDADEVTFRSAEAWLAAHGVERNPITVDTSTLPPVPAPPTPPGAGEQPPGAPPDAMPAAVDVADQTDQSAAEPERLEDAVARAVSFIRRSTNRHPASEGRLRHKLEQRGAPARAVDLAIQQARRERLVDDDALVRALAAERRDRGHAATRIRVDLRRRGFPDDLIDAALASTEREDPEAVAFGVARTRAASYGHLEPETAFRRLVGYLARRGHAEGLARKVAREVVWADREHERTAGH